MNNIDIYKLQEWVTIWEGAALILDIDPADVIERTRRHSDSPTYSIGEILPAPGDDSFYLEPDKIAFLYQKTIDAILHSVIDFAPELKIRGSRFNHDAHWEANQSSELKIDDLIKWALKNGFKSQFLGNLEPVSDDTTDQQPTSKGEAPSKTALKVIGLFMLHLNKGKYSNNGKPNKSQIKELLIALSKDNSIDDYGLSKVDERLLTDALAYLKEQKKD